MPEVDWVEKYFPDRGGWGLCCKVRASPLSAWWEFREAVFFTDEGDRGGARRYLDDWVAQGCPMRQAFDDILEGNEIVLKREGPSGRIAA